MSDTGSKPKGKTTRELLAIVKEDRRRWDLLSDVWDELYEHQKTELIRTANAMKEANDEKELAAGPAPESLRA